MPFHPIHLPLELWQHIASFVPWNDLQRLHSVNSVFFGLANDERFRQVYFNETTKQYDNLVERLKDPDIARQVRMLVIRPRILEDLIYSARPSSIPIPSPFFSTMSKFLARIMGLDAFSQTIGKTKAVAAGVFSPSYTDIRKRSLFLSSMRGLSCISEYQMEQNYEDGFNFDRALEIMTHIWPIVGANLSTLTFEMSTDELKILPAPIELPRLCNLQLRFIKTYLWHYEDNTPVLINILPPFINGLYNSLHSLGITFFGNINCLNLYHKFEYFPHLTKLSVTFPTDASFIVARSGVTSFIKRHSCNLRELSIDVDSRPTSIDIADELQYGLYFPHLSHLKLHLDAHWMLLPAMVIPFARRNDLLTTLDLGDVFLSYLDADSILARFSDILVKIKNLSLAVHKLPVAEFVDILADRAPNLNILVLVLPRLDPDFIQAMDLRSTVVSVIAYDKWRLHDITISCWGDVGRDLHLERQWEYMDAVAKCVPSIRSFSGQGNMRWIP